MNYDDFNYPLRRTLSPVDEQYEINSFKKHRRSEAKNIKVEVTDIPLKSTGPKRSKKKKNKSKLTFLSSFIDSFKRKQEQAGSPDSSELLKDDEQDLDVKRAENNSGALDKAIKPRHLLFISLGTGIGTGLLVGTGEVLSKAGPGGLIIGYAVSSIMVFCTVEASGELAVRYQNLTGNFIRYPFFLVDPALSVATAFLYTLQWLTSLPLQLVSAAITIGYWTNINSNIFVCVILVSVIIINLFGVTGFVEVEFFCNLCKVLMVTGFIILSIVLNAGGADNQGYIGARYWINPGTFANGFKGVCSVFCYAAFSYGGVELLALSASEQKDPLRSIPKACRTLIYRILFVYLLTLILICFNVPYNSPGLMGAGVDPVSFDPETSQTASPFTIAVSSYGVKVVPDIINFVILLSVISMANSSLYFSTRLLLTLSELKFLPKFLQFIDRKGRPMFCYLIGIAFGFIGFLSSVKARNQVFVWLLSLGGLSQMITWMVICLSHIRLRDAYKRQNRSFNDLHYKSRAGYYGSYLAVIMAFLALVAQFWISISPVPYNGKTLDVNHFFQNYLALPIMIVIYFAYKIYYKDWKLFIRSKDIDLNAHQKLQEKGQGTITVVTTGTTETSKEPKESSQE